MSQHSFSLTTIGMTQGRALVKLDGEDISDAVRGVGLDFSAKDHPRVMLELADISADVAVGDVGIQLSRKTENVLQWLGWATPGKYEALCDAARFAVAAFAAGDRSREQFGMEVMRTTLQDLGQLPDVPTSDESASEGPSAGVGESIT